MERLQALRQLLDTGAITPAEFEVARRQLVGEPPPAMPVGMTGTGRSTSSGEGGQALVLGGILALVGAGLSAVNFFAGPWDVIGYWWSERNFIQVLLILAAATLPLLSLVGLGVLFLIGTGRREFRGALGAVGILLALDAPLWSGGDIGLPVVAGVLGGLIAAGGSFAWGRQGPARRR